MIYSYFCTECLVEYEVNKSMSESSNDEFCPECLSKMERVYTPTRFILKGVGWHASDYTKDYQKSTHADKRAESIKRGKLYEVPKTVFRDK